MNRLSSRLVVLIMGMALLAAAIVQDAAAQGRLNEEAALKLLQETLRHDLVYKDRISLDCITFSSEDETPGFFAFVLREKHTGKCGGDPETSPVVDRYRVNRASERSNGLSQ